MLNFSLFQSIKASTDSINYERLCKTFLDIVNGMSDEVKHRDENNSFSSIEAFLKSRTNTVGAILCLNLGLFANNFEVPKEFCDREACKELTSAAINMGIITNVK